VKLAFTISAYRLCDFVHLGLNQLRKLSPDSPILVCDDPSPESLGIRSHAEQHMATYDVARKRRGHFAGDFQSLVSALVFAQSRGADVAVKVSQRFIFRRPESIEAIQRAFTDPNIMVATPGQPVVNGVNRATKGFGQFTTLSDIVAIRVGAISAEEMLHMYRQKLLTDRAPWGSFIECAVDSLHGKFAGRTVKMEELTNPQADPWFLRRYQATEQDYRNLALADGWNGRFPVEEWGAMEGRKYLCKPRVV
jgi:hypothetical protein